MSSLQAERSHVDQNEPGPDIAPVLTVENLRVVFAKHGREVQAVNGLNYQLSPAGLWPSSANPAPASRSECGP